MIIQWTGQLRPSLLSPMRVGLTTTSVIETAGDQDRLGGMSFAALVMTLDGYRCRSAVVLA